MNNQLSEQQYFEIAKEYAMKNGDYDIVTYIGDVDGLRVYDYTHQSLIGRKTGLPHFIEVSETGVVKRVRDMDKIYKYWSML